MQHKHCHARSPCCPFRELAKITSAAEEVTCWGAPCLFTSAVGLTTEHQKIPLSKVRNFTPVSLRKESSSLTREQSIKRQCQKDHDLKVFRGLLWFASFLYFFLLEQDQQGRAPFILYHKEISNNTELFTEMNRVTACNGLHLCSGDCDTWPCSVNDLLKCC